jgi:acid-sensing ion channel, other
MLLINTNVKRKFKLFWCRIKNLFVNYIDHSTIHGVPYLAERGRSWFEKTWWLTIVIIAVVCCGKLIFDAWHINPIIIKFAEKPTHIWEIPFPAVTICPFTFARTDRINLTKLILHQYNGGSLFHGLTDKE